MSLFVNNMRIAAKISANILYELKSQVNIGMSTWDIDQLSVSLFEKYNVKSAFLGYRGYPAHICTSLNRIVVHGIPRKDQILKSGDYLKIDLGVIYEGYYGDNATHVFLGDVDDTIKDLVEATKASLRAGIIVCKAGNTVDDISIAIYKEAKKYGYDVIRKFAGHFIGTKLHIEPHIPNYKAGIKRVLKSGDFVCLEPMLYKRESNSGIECVTSPVDGWSVSLFNGEIGSHLEDTVMVTKYGGEVVTVPDEPFVNLYNADKGVV